MHPGEAPLSKVPDTVRSEPETDYLSSEEEGVGLGQDLKRENPASHQPRSRSGWGGTVLGARAPSSSSEVPTFSPQHKGERYVVQQLE